MDSQMGVSAGLMLTRRCLLASPAACLLAASGRGLAQIPATTDVTERRTDNGNQTQRFAAVRQRPRRPTSPARFAWSRSFRSATRRASAAVTSPSNRARAPHGIRIRSARPSSSRPAWAGCKREGGPIEEIRPGDVVWFPPGEKHWHGATPTTAMTHIAVRNRSTARTSTGWKRSATSNTASRVDSTPSPTCVSKECMVLVHEASSKFQFIVAGIHGSGS